MRDDWYDLVIKAGDIVNITGKLDLSRHCHVIDNNSINLVITYPDLLISATTISDSFECLRKAYLQNKTGSSNQVSSAMVHGKMLHELFQMSLETGDFSIVGIRHNLEYIIQNSTLELYSISEKETDAMSTLSENSARLADWGKTYFGSDISVIVVSSFNF